ncbi:MAG TPA: FMN-binding protein [Clostridiaceae bacterium]|nr:FMN-binding protein [Clostridiaceae bacterium]
MKKKYAVFSIFAIIVVGIIAAVIGIKSNLKKSMEELAKITISDVDLSQLENGSYTGSYKTGLVSAKVKVKVNDHKIIEVELLEHNNGKGAPAEIIPDKVVEAQTLNVDTVSGATYSSKVILKAIENALNSVND